MDSVVVSHRKFLKNHQKKEADFLLIKLMVLPSKKLKKLEFRLEGKFKSLDPRLPFDPHELDSTFI